MNFFKKNIVNAFLTMVSCGLLAQQDPTYTHYMYNTLAVNPAYAGSRDALTITALNRLQWVGFGDGAPITQTFTAHTPIAKDNFGLGVSFVNDKLNPINTSALYADFAYKLKLNDKSSLSFGLKGGGSIFQANLSSLGLETDPTFQQNLSSKFLANVGAGLYYKRERFYAGISSPKLLNNSVKLKSTAITLSPESQHVYLIVGGVLPINNNWSFKPTTLLKATKGGAFQADLTASFVVNKKIFFGLNYRTGDAIGALLGYQISNQFFASYSYDWSYMLATGKYNSGSHEIMIRYDFDFNDKQKIYSPRNF